jgi:hypothetical protein
MKRYDCTNGRAQHCYGCYTMEENTDGDYVKADEHFAEVARLQALVPRWVPIAEGLPKEPGDYLVMLAEHNDWELRSSAPVMVEFDAFTDKPQQFTHSDSWTNGPEVITAAVTYWQPLTVPQ